MALKHATRRIAKLADLAQLKKEVEISPGQFIEVRPLNLLEMVRMFVNSMDSFLPLYSAGLDGKFDAEGLAPFLLTCPELVAQIIALASDEPESAPVVEKHMPATVQLIALAEIWKLSVPDAKKARELLSEVTALLRKLQERQNSKAPEDMETVSPTTLPVP